MTISGWWLRLALHGPTGADLEGPLPGGGEAELIEETMERFRLSTLEMMDEDAAAPPETFRKVEERFLASGRCTLCNKQATDGQRAAAERRRCVQETCQLERILGAVDCPRRFEPHGAVGCDVLTQKALKAYWGPKIGELASYLQRMMERGACLKYKYSEIMPAMNVTSDQALKLQPLNPKHLFKP